MKVSYNWLKDFVEINEPVESLRQKLTMAGVEVTDCQKKSGDSVLEIEITSNRPDWLSHIGVAREIAAITKSKIKNQKLNIKNKDQKNNLLVKITIEDKKDCPLYTGMIIDNISINKPDPIIAERLAILGLRPISPIVDITNYILLETGQPMHAFDLDKITARSPSHQLAKSHVEISIRRAKQEEKIITIDNVERTLSSDILVIADSDGPIAIAGVMGGKDTEVDNSTKRVLLESAYFDPITVRRSRQKLGITTESSYRFERSVHMPTVLKAQERAGNLIKTISPGANFSKIYSNGSISKRGKNISLKLDINSLNQTLGIDLAGNEVVSILKRLQFGIGRTSGGKRLKVNIPDFRSDINLPEDIFEEVARIYGYDNILVSLPKICMQGQKKPAADIDEVTDLINKTLCACGFFEVITYSLMSRDKVTICPDESIIPIANPLSKEQEILRPSLLPGLLEAAAYNFNHSQDDVKIFEMGGIFEHLNNKTKEGLNLGILSCGEKICDWHRQAILKEKNAVNFFDLKGVVESILSELGIEYEKVSFREGDLPIYAPGETANIFINEKEIGSLGKVNSQLLNKWDIRKQNLFASLIDLEALLEFVDLKKNFKKFSSFPAAERDLSFIIKENISVKEIKEAINKEGIKFLENISLFDEYKGKNIPKGFRSLSFSFKFSGENHTLKEEEINNSLAKIKTTLMDKFSVSMREN
ncbi:MAG: phenylalanine--tRNA ligase subunit beta [Candidatus Omnitrophota bacterium]